MNHLHGLELEVHAQTVLEMVEKPEDSHTTSSYDSQGKCLEMISLLVPILVKMQHGFKIFSKSVVKGTSVRILICVGRSFILLFLIVCAYICFILYLSHFISFLKFLCLFIPTSSSIFPLTLS